VIIGPGLGDEKDTERVVIDIIKSAIKKQKSLVIDADAIKPIGKNLDIIKNTKTVITPHIREFKDLSGLSLSDNLDDRINEINRWLVKIGVNIFLKSYIDILSNGKMNKLNDIHNVAMTVGGTGDVLAGIIGSLLSKNVDTFNAMRIAAFINGMAGVECFKRKSFGMLATDIIDEIPYILKKYL
jgi:NAD(P)H-hydrate epimerase